MTREWGRLRSSEWVLVGFFAYLAVIAPFFRDRPRLGYQPVVVLLAVAVVLITLAEAETRLSTPISMVRDWLPMGLTLVAFREMELFIPARYNASLEYAWEQWDELVLNHWGLRSIVDSLGPVIPAYLELCYVLVYAVGTFCIVVLWVETRRRQVDHFYVVLLVGTLLAYALFPYFPSRPPRIVFPALDAPAAHSVFRRFNIFLLNRATIHSGVFPSAHVSSAFSAAWAMFLTLPHRKIFGVGLLIYAFSVSVATVYGRYHYAADALAGFGISTVAGLLALTLARKTKSVSDGHPAGTDAHLIA